MRIAVIPSLYTPLDSGPQLLTMVFPSRFISLAHLDEIWRA